MEAGATLLGSLEDAGFDEEDDAHSGCEFFGWGQPAGECGLAVADREGGFLELCGSGIDENFGLLAESGGAFISGVLADEFIGGAVVELERFEEDADFQGRFLAAGIEGVWLLGGKRSRVEKGQREDGVKEEISDYFRTG